MLQVLTLAWELFSLYCLLKNYHSRPITVAYIMKCGLAQDVMLNSNRRCN